MLTEYLACSGVGFRYLADMTTDPRFIHLRVHSEYSLLEGAIPVKKLPGLAAEMDMPAVAVTDTNNMFGALEFSEKMRESGVQPIIGLECIIADSRGRGEVVLLAQSEAGYEALCRHNSRALLEVEGGDDPVIRLESLAGDGEGLILLTGGAVRGFVGAAAAEGQAALVDERLLSLIHI